MAGLHAVGGHGAARQVGGGFVDPICSSRVLIYKFTIEDCLIHMCFAVPTYINLLSYRPPRPFIYVCRWSTADGKRFTDDLETAAGVVDTENGWTVTSSWYVYAESPCAMEAIPKFTLHLLYYAAFYLPSTLPSSQEHHWHAGPGRVAIRHSPGLALLAPAEHQYSM